MQQPGAKNGKKGTSDKFEGRSVQPLFILLCPLTHL